MGKPELCRRAVKPGIFTTASHLVSMMMILTAYLILHAY